MIRRDLFESILISPIQQNLANELFIVSGYASATFARKHILELLKYSNNFRVNLIIGMPGRRSDHLAFLELHREFDQNFSGYYYNGQIPVHSKVYCWFQQDEAFQGYAGSANYSQYGFLERLQVNQLSIEDPKEIRELFNELINDSVYIPLSQIIVPEGHRPEVIGNDALPGGLVWEIPNRRVRVSFLAKNGTLPESSGLNWGHRVEIVYRNGEPVGRRQRNRNEAYLSLKGSSRDLGFLPVSGFTFSLITDDGQSFDCVVAQQGRKAIETTNSNTILGLYLRRRLGLEEGSLVTIEDLRNYGRTDFTIEKIDEETFLLDLSVRRG